MENPFEVMEEYSPEQLEGMSLDELLDTQRRVLFPHEQVLFDRGESIFLGPEDKRSEFLDFTDDLIVAKAFDRVSPVRKKVQEQRKSFKELRLGDLFGFLEGSDLDKPYDETKRIMMKTNGNWPAKDAGERFWENYSNAVSTTDGYSKAHNIWIVEPDEMVVPLEIVE